METIQTTHIKLRNVILAFKDQLPIKRLIKNIISQKIFGVFHKRSHFRDNGQAKITFNHRESAVKSAERMTAKKGIQFKVYKCIYCDGYHIGANRYLMNNKEYV